MMHIDTQRERVRAIYGMLNDILWQLERSECFNYIPGTKLSGSDHFEGALSKVEAAIQRDFLGETDLRRRLERITAEVRRLVNSREIPGANSRWLKIDPELRYFDVVFDMLKDEPELYAKIVRYQNQATPGKIAPHFSFQPTPLDILQRESYFKAARKKNEKLNNHFSEERLLQNEVVRALELVMLHDFPELFGPEAA